MSDTPATPRREPFAGLWPWPGNAFLVLFAAWLFYMGSIATLEDVRTAFFGLGGVTMVTLMLGLRAAVAGRARRPARTARADGDRKRSAIPPSDTAAIAAGAGAHDGERTNVRSMYPVELVRDALRRDDAGEAILELEAAMTRERAERGAQLVKLEQAVAVLSARFAGAADGTAPGASDGNAPGDAHLAERVRVLEQRLHGERPDGAELAAVTARLGAVERRIGTDVPDMTSFLKVQAFNNAISERLVPRMQQMIANSQHERGVPGGGDAIAAQLAEVRQAMAAAHDAARDERAALQDEMRAVRELAERSRAAGEASPGPTAVEIASLKNAREIDHREIMELKAALAARGDGEAVGGGVMRRLSALEASVERIAGAEAAFGEVREAVATLGRDIALAADGWREALRRLDTRAHGTDLPEAPADVAALRDALTTIIAQNRDIRTQQELLSARLDPPTPVEVDTRPR